MALSENTVHQPVTFVGHRTTISVRAFAKHLRNLSISASFNKTSSVKMSSNEIIITVPRATETRESRRASQDEVAIGQRVMV